MNNNYSNPPDNSDGKGAKDVRNTGSHHSGSSSSTHWTEAVAIPDDGRLIHQYATATVTREAALVRSSPPGDKKMNVYGEDVDNDYVVENAVLLPTTFDLTNGGNRDDLDQRATDEGTRRGLAKAEEEVYEIFRNNCKVPAINNMQDINVNAANENALVQNFREEYGLVQTTTTATIQSMGVTAASPLTSHCGQTTRQEPVFFAGSYGKEYETSEYKTAEYSTSDYETSQYKSVYES